MQETQRRRATPPLFLTVLGSGGWREAVAAADRRNFEMERRVFGVAAFVDQTFGGLMRGEDGHESLVLLVGFAEVGTKSALSIMNCWHIDLLRSVRC